MGLYLSKQQPCPTSRWSDLPPELGGLILRRLPSHTDRLGFTFVCRQWRIAAKHQAGSLPPALPWVRLNHRAFQSLPGGELRRLKAVDVHRRRRRGASIRLCSCTNDGWLVYQTVSVSRASIAISCLLVNPFTGATIHVPPPLPKGRDLIGKMIVCSPDLFAAILRSSTAVGFYRPGARSPSWSVYPAPSDRLGRIIGLRDIAFHRGKLYVLTNTDELYSHDLIVDGNGDDKAHAVEHVIKEPASSAMTYGGYLVASEDKLLMVKWNAPWSSFMAQNIREKCEGIKFMVFEADLEMGRWSAEVKDGLDGQALFVSRDCSRAIRLSTSNDHEFQGDHVYFLGANLDLVGSCFRSYLYGSYDLRNPRISQMFLNKNKKNIKDIHYPGWFFPCM